MKNAILMVILMILFIITGCREVGEEAYAFEAMFDASGDYVGFEDVSQRCTDQEAADSGYLTLIDGDIVANEGAWDAFIASAVEDESAYIRMASFYTVPSSGPYYTDVYYEDGYYYRFDSTAICNEAKPYEHLLHLEGYFGMPKQLCAVTVLSNDETLTFDAYMESLYSSRLILNGEGSNTQLVMFN